MFEAAFNELNFYYIMDNYKRTMQENDRQPDTNFPFKAIIFDMDGTLIESTEADYLAWKRVFNDQGKELSFKDYQPLLGIRSAEVIKHTLGVQDDNIVKKLLAEKLEYFREIAERDGIQPVEGAIQFLKECKALNVKIALATSSRQAKMKMIMTRLELIDLFDAIVTGEEVHNSKPSPDIFLDTARKLALDPIDCIVFEDAVNGVKAAKAAGMMCIAIATTHPAEQLNEADLVIHAYNINEFTQFCTNRNTLV
jgi:beta-phosphoglucomutase